MILKISKILIFALIYLNRFIPLELNQTTLNTCYIDIFTGYDLF